MISYPNPKRSFGKIIPLSTIENHRGTDNNRITVIVDKRIRLIDLSQISHFESDSNYTKLFLTTGEKILSCKTLKRFEDRIDNQQFLRIHKFFLINVNHISHFDPSDNTLVMRSGDLIPVSRARKQLLMHYLKSLMA